MKLDKKQLPQYIALGVLTAGVGGYSVYHFAAAGPVSAATAAAAPRASATAPAQAAKPVPAGAAVAADTGDAPPPTPAMRDPFTVGYVDPGTLPAPLGGAAPPVPALPAPGKQVAALSPLSPLPVGLPSAPPLPGSGLGLFPAKAAGLPSALPAAPPAPVLPAAPALPDPPKWTVTGVLMGEGGEVAILRNGEARRIVRAGDFVDSVYRVSAVSRTAVQLRHGALVYRIVLGADKPAPGASSAPASAPASTPPLKLQMPAVMGSVILPAPHAAPPHLPPAKVARAISLGLRLLDGSVLAPRTE